MFFLFGRGFSGLKKGESNEVIENRVKEYLGQLENLEKDISKLDKTDHLQYVDLLLEQANKIYHIEKNVTYRVVNLVENYKKLLYDLESRRKEADLKMKKFENECDERIKTLRKSKLGKEEVKIIINEREDAKKSHDQYVEKIKMVENKLIMLRDSIEKTCREKAVDSKIISENRWI